MNAKHSLVGILSLSLVIGLSSGSRASIFDDVADKVKDVGTSAVDRGRDLANKVIPHPVDTKGTGQPQSQVIVPQPRLKSVGHRDPITLDTVLTTPIPRLKKISHPSTGATSTMPPATTDSAVLPAPPAPDVIITPAPDVYDSYPQPSHCHQGPYQGGMQRANVQIITFVKNGVVYRVEIPVRLGGDW